jgi:hypothetical protein
MNETFNINRFRLLVMRQWSENKKVYFLLWGVISLSIVLLSAIIGNSDNNEMGLLYTLLFCVAGCVMCTSLFSRWSDPGRSSLFLLLPASSFEKMLSGLFYGIILFIPVYSLNFVFIRYIMTYLVDLYLPNNLVHYTSFTDSRIWETVSAPFRFFNFQLMSFLFAQSLCMISILSFRKRQLMIFSLTVLILLIVYNTGVRTLVLNLTHIPAGTVLSPGIFLPYSSLSFGYIGFTGTPPVFEYFSFIRQIRVINDLIWFAVFFLLYLTAWYKLKERQL